MFERLGKSRLTKSYTQSNRFGILVRLAQITCLRTSQWSRRTQVGEASSLGSTLKFSNSNGER